jgi:Protein of unknown function (DUF3574)
MLPHARIILFPAGATTMARWAVLAFVLAGLFGCAATAPPGCQGSASSSVVAELLFGRRIGEGGVVSDADWARFVRDEVTPRFPDGLTVLDGAGQWRDAERGLIIREPTKVLLIVLSGDATSRTLLVAVADAYKRRFSQQSVVTILRPACVSF